MLSKLLGQKEVHSLADVGWQEKDWTSSHDYHQRCLPRSYVLAAEAEVEIAEAVLYGASQQQLLQELASVDQV